MRPELLDEIAFERLDRATQRDLIAEHCGGVEQRIAAAPSAADAESILQDACERFRRECQSRIVRLALERYVRDVFRRYWREG